MILVTFIEFVLWQNPFFWCYIVLYIPNLSFMMLLFKMLMDTPSLICTQAMKLLVYLRFVAALFYPLIVCGFFNTVFKFFLYDSCFMSKKTLYGSMCFLTDYNQQFSKQCGNWTKLSKAREEKRDIWCCTTWILQSKVNKTQETNQAHCLWNEQIILKKLFWC